jgi:hypothetical protein
VYLNDYHIKINKELGFKDTASLMITEINVPRKDLTQFMEDVRKVALKDDFDIIYGTIRLIRKGIESFLAWAKEDYVCVIFNLRVFHTPDVSKKPNAISAPLLMPRYPTGIILSDLSSLGKEGSSVGLLSAVP